VGDFAGNKFYYFPQPVTTQLCSRPQGQSISCVGEGKQPLSSLFCFSGHLHCTSRL